MISALEVKGRDVLLTSLEEFPGDWEWTGFWPGSFILEEIRNQCNIALLIQELETNQYVTEQGGLSPYRQTFIFMGL